MIISLHPTWDVLANDRGGLLPHPYHPIQLLLLPPKTSQIKETNHNYHVTATIETWRSSTHSNKPQPSFSCFSLPVLCFIFPLKCLSIWSEKGRKQNKRPSKQTNENAQQQTIQTKQPPQLHVNVSGHCNHYRWSLWGLRKQGAVWLQIITSYRAIADTIIWICNQERRRTVLNKHLFV